MLNVFLADDHNIVRNGIKVLLEADEEIKVVGEAINGNEVLTAIKSIYKIDIILADINMPEMDGISLIKELKKIKPETKIVILSMHDDEKYILQAFLEGAAGYMLKNVNPEELIFGLKFINNGGQYLCDELTMKIIANLIQSKQFSTNYNKVDIDFSTREIEVLNLIADGLTNSEMSEKLFISKRTIEGHRQSLIEKTKSRNTASLIRFAMQNGIIS